MLNLDIYGLKVRINFVRPEDEKELTSLLKLFLRKEGGGVDLELEFKKEERPQEIGGLLFPHLAKRGIWAMHAGAFQFKKGFLTIGPSCSGKSTLSFLALEKGFSVISDDVTLVRESGRFVEMLPFYSIIFLNGRSTSLELQTLKPAILKYLIFPKLTSGFNLVKRLEKKVDILKKIVPQFLWSLDRSTQEKQKRFLEKICNCPGFEMYWNTNLLKDDSIFRGMLNEVMQGQG